MRRRREDPRSHQPVEPVEIGIHVDEPARPEQISHILSTLCAI